MPYSYIPKFLELIENRRLIRRPAIWLTQIAIFLGSGLAAFFLRFGYTIPESEVSHLAFALGTWLIVKSIVFQRGRLMSTSWRSTSTFDVVRLTLFNGFGSLVSSVPIFFAFGFSFPRSIQALDLVLCLLGSAGIRILYRVVSESISNASSGATRVLIYGAGKAGDLLLRDLRADDRLRFIVCGFVDDDPEKAGHYVQGVPVLGEGANLGQWVDEKGVQEILIAIPTATGEQLGKILQYCSQVSVPYKMVPRLSDVIQGKSIAQQIRRVAVEDLLGRDPVNLDEIEISSHVRGRTVLVTGAGGSIGSELCRQLARFEPLAIIGYENAENALYHLQIEMQERFQDVAFHPRIGSIQNASRFAEVLHEFRPQLVYHAAAYKHVPLMESHIVEVVENNVIGTATIAQVCASFGLEEFVMISTDKAVRPASLLGVTKRVAELFVHSMNGNKTKFVSVRFGNVLGSNGSVIPRFEKQIAAGGPVTVTHPDMERYFMTIPEASQLVLQAAAMGSGGEIFVLDMGKPVKIVDLARNLIVLSGMRPEKDIQVEFSGLRPGEKMFEELNSSDEKTVPTSHEKIAVFRGPTSCATEMTEHLRTLREACAQRDIRRLLLTLKEVVPEYNPSSQLLRQILETEHMNDSLVTLLCDTGFSQGNPFASGNHMAPEPSSTALSTQ